MKHTILNVEKENNGNTYFRITTDSETFNFFVNKNRERENLGDSLKEGTIIEGEVTGVEGKRFMREIEVVGFQPHANAQSVPKEQRPDLRSKEKNNLQQCKSSIICELIKSEKGDINKVFDKAKELFKLLEEK